MVLQHPAHLHVVLCHVACLALPLLGSLPLWLTLFVCLCVDLYVSTLQAKQDMEQVKQMASGAVNKLSSMAGRFMNDLSRY